MSTATIAPTMTPRPRPATQSAFFGVLKVLASLRVTVALFVLSMILVFFGTLALIEGSMWSVIKEYFKSFVVFIRLDLLRHFLITFFHFPPTMSPFPRWLAIPFPGGVTIAIALLINMTAAHLVRFKFAWNRVGIIVLHAGLIVLLGGELLTRFFAVEATMTIQQGETVNFTDVSDASELALIDASNPQADEVVAISHKALQRSADRQTIIRHDSLPVDVRVNAFYKNSKPVFPSRVKESDGAALHRATDANGMPWDFFAVDESSGVDQDMRENATAAHITLLRKGTDQVLGSYFVTCWFDSNFTRRNLEFPRQSFSVDGKTYQLSLRPKRDYKPYSIHLKKFEFERYPGTDKPKDYASTVQLIHPENGENREVRIWMNNPLRYDSDKVEGIWGTIETLNPIWNGSETFFQSAFTQDERGTVLQVVRNPSWLWPYISCILVTLGMMIHFTMLLVKFFVKLVRGVPGTAAVKTTAAPAARNLWPLALATFLVFVFALYLTSKARMPKSPEGTLDYTSFGRLPVLEGGRVQPLDSFARNTMMAISNSDQYEVAVTSEKTETRPAIRWLLEVMGTRDLFGTEGAKAKVIRIDSIELLDFLKLEKRPGFYRYAPVELKPSYEKFIAEYESVRPIDSKKRTLFQQRVFELGNKMGLYDRIVFLKSPLVVPPMKESGDWLSMHTVDTVIAEPSVASKTQQIIQQIVEELAKEGQTFEKLPPEKQKLIQQKLSEMRHEWTIAASDKFRAEAAPSAEEFMQILRLGRAGKVEEFRQAIQSYRDTRFEFAAAKDLRKTGLEVWLNAFDPFYWCSVLFIVAFASTLISWLGWSVPTVRKGFWLGGVFLLLLTLVVQVTAMLVRMQLMERPFVFVTNLYSSAVFIGTCVAGLCLILEAVSRIGIGSAVAAALGFGTTYIARHLQTTGDTLEMMQAVLDTNFWLATHVTTVTFGYAATFVAGGIAILYILLGMFTPLLRGDTAKTVSGMLYGTICFATFLSFVGTVLGGIWADQSWGRFWGWDPKENGALLIVAWNALILHARWAGLVKPRGIAILAIGGIAVTMWSWFGTNQLGIGLHAYGFNKTLANWCTAVWVTSVALMIPPLLIPTEHWKSFKPVPRS